MESRGFDVAYLFAQFVLEVLIAKDEKSCEDSRVDDHELCYHEEFKDLCCLSHNGSIPFQTHLSGYVCYWLHCRALTVACLTISGLWIDDFHS